MSLANISSNRTRLVFQPIGYFRSLKNSASICRIYTSAQLNIFFSLFKLLCPIAGAPSHV